MKGWIAAIAAGIVLSGCGGGSETAAPSVTTTTTTTTTVSPDKAVGAWGSDQLAPSLDAIGKDFVWVGGAMQGLDFADARAGCRHLDTTVDQLEAKLPSPDDVLTGYLSDAVEDLRQFSRQCQGLNPRTSKSELDEMTVYRERAETAMGKAVDVVKAAQQAAG